MEQASPKIVRLNCTGTTTEDLLIELLDKHRTGDLTGMIITATVKDETGRGSIRRWFFDKDRLCTNILGLWEYTKQYIIDYMRNEEGAL
ncbi:MAG: hypothetical protein DRJ03_01230 [Chloroflexi bacterium]|nr:MAG: hypothetical protein DRJ03_01230 [Chloroflexota bacterium]